MAAHDFFLLTIDHYGLFLSSILLISIILFFSIRKETIAGILDPFHFYWTFTFGTAYGVVISLYILGEIQTYLFLMVMSYGFFFIASFHIIKKFKPNKQRSILFYLFNSKKINARLYFLVALLVFVLINSILLDNKGLGFFSETNRFEENRGYGFLVRINDTIRLFIISYLTIRISIKTNHKTTPSTIILILPLIFIVIFSSIMNGSKFALLESIYASLVAIIAYGIKLNINLRKVIFYSLVAFSFSYLALMVNLEKNNYDTSEKGSYITSIPITLERLWFRILGNGDKYYLGLPNNVVEYIDTDNAAIRFLSPLIGSSRLSNIIGYNVNDYNVGRQLLLYRDPNREIAGGPTSHFDLFSYIYFGYILGFLWIFFSAFLLVNIIKLVTNSYNDILLSSMAATLYLRSLPILLEPPIGIAYIIDVMIIFMLIKFIVTIFQKKKS